MKKKPKAYRFDPERPRFEMDRPLVDMDPIELENVFDELEAMIPRMFKEE